MFVLFFFLSLLSDLELDGVEGAGQSAGRLLRALRQADGRRPPLARLVQQMLQTHKQD